MGILQLEKTLKNDVKPALGCTEPIAIALAACRARGLTEQAPKEITVRLSSNLIKNAMEVSIPNTGGQHGIALAAALGSLCPTEEPDLTLLEGLSEATLGRAKGLVDKGIVAIEIAEEHQGLYLDVSIFDEGGTRGRCVITGTHENIVLLEKNGEAVFCASKDQSAGADKVSAGRKKLADIPFAQLWDGISGISNELRELLLKGVEMNMLVAEAGLNKEGSLDIGNVYKLLMKEGWMGTDIINEAKSLTAAAVDARMSGCNLPAMTSAGSGNQGLAITLPLQALAKHLKADDQKLSEALAISHGITSILKHHSGTLSAMCGCVVCSGLGLACGITYLMGGTLENATAAVNNMVGSVTGIICDGAKVGCAIKLTCAIDSAFQSAMMALKGLKLPNSNGVIGTSIEESLANVGLIATFGMDKTDDQILAIMLNKAKC